MKVEIFPDPECVAQQGGKFIAAEARKPPWQPVDVSLWLLVAGTLRG